MSEEKAPIALQPVEKEMGDLKSFMESKGHPMGKGATVEAQPEVKKEPAATAAPEKPKEVTLSPVEAKATDTGEDDAYDEALLLIKEKTGFKVGELKKLGKKAVLARAAQLRSEPTQSTETAPEAKASDHADLKKLEQEFGPELVAFLKKRDDEHAAEIAKLRSEKETEGRQELAQRIATARKRIGERFPDALDDDKIEDADPFFKAACAKMQRDGVAFTEETLGEAIVMALRAIGAKEKPSPVVVERQEQRKQSEFVHGDGFGFTPNRSQEEVSELTAFDAWRQGNRGPAEALARARSVRR